MLRLKLNNLLKCLVTTRTISSVPSVLSRDIVRVPHSEVSKSPEDENQFTHRVKATSDPHDLLELMSMTHHKDIESHQLSHALKHLFVLQKNSYNSVHPSQLTKHAGFSNILQMLKFKSSRMEGNELVAALKFLNFFRLKSDSLIVQRLLNLIKDKINDLTPNQLIFLNFLLLKMHTSPLIEALQIAIPVVLEITISQKLDHNNQSELAELLHFLSKSSLRISSRSLTSIVTALTLHGNNLELHHAKSVLWSLTSLQQLDSSYEKLIENCFNVVSSKCIDMSFEDIESTLSRLLVRIQRGDYVFYNEEFFNQTVKMCLVHDEGYLNASYLLKKFNKINYVNFELLDYIDKAIFHNHSNLSSCKIAGLLTFASGFSNANFKSENWEIIKSVLHENPLMHSEKMELPWIRFTVEMMSLGFHSNILLEKVFSTRLLEVYLNREENVLDHLQLLLLWQSVKLLIPEYEGPLPDQRFIDDAILINTTKSNEAAAGVLAQVFGGREFIQTNVASSHGHCLDCVISFDANENPIAMPCKIAKFDDFPKSQVKSVAVFLHGKGCYPFNYPEKIRGIFDLRRRTIEALNIRNVNISTQLLNSMMENEKYEYLEREIRYALR